MIVKNDSKYIIAINTNAAKAVNIVGLNEQHRSDFKHIKIRAKDCFQNSYNIVSMYPNKYAYVLGVNNSFGFAFEHAFIKDLQSGEYIDPTLDAIGKSDCKVGMFSLIEMDYVQLSEIISLQKTDAYPPDFNVMSNLKLHQDIFITFKDWYATKDVNKDHSDSSLSL